MKLITKAAQKLKDKGFRQVSSHIENIHTGDINYVVFEFRGETYLVRAKEYVYKGRAPFGVGMTERAVASGHLLTVYFDDRGKFYVFDPAFVHNHGERTTGRSKLDDSRDWFEVDLTDGVLLEEYTAGKTALAGRESGTDSDPTSLKDFL